MISDIPNVSLGIVDCSLYTCRIALKVDYLETRKDTLVYAPVKYEFLETLGETFIIHATATHNHFLQENIFHNAPSLRVAIAMNTNSAFTGSSTENPFWYQQFDLRQMRILRRDSQSEILTLLIIVVYMWLPWKQTTFRMIFHQSPLMISKITMCWCLIWLQCRTLTENCHYPELAGEPLGLQLNFTYPVENVTELIVLDERMSSVAVDKSGVVWKIVWKGTIMLCNNLSTASFCSNFGTSVRSPKTMFQRLILILWLKSTRKPAICRVNIGSWLQISDRTCTLQTLFDVGSTVFSSSTTRKWCQHAFSLTQVYAVFIQFMQLSIPSNSDKKKLQELTLSMYFDS